MAVIPESLPVFEVFLIRFSQCVAINESLINISGVAFR